MSGAVSFDVARAPHDLDEEDGAQREENRRQGTWCGLVAPWGIVLAAPVGIVLAAPVGIAHDPIERVVTVDAMSCVVFSYAIDPIRGD